MKFNDEIGIIYDCIYFGIIYFYQRAFSDGCSPFEDDMELAAEISSDISFKYYDEIYCPALKIPKELHPFFYYDGKKPCLLTSYFNTMDYETLDFSHFIALLNDKDKFSRHAAKRLLTNIEYWSTDYLLEVNHIQDVDCFIDDLPEKEKKIFAGLTKSFHACVDKLICYLMMIHPQIVQLHERCDEEKKRLYSLYATREYQFVFTQHYRPNNEKEKRMISFCLLHKHILYLQFCCNSTFFLLGSDIKNYLLQSRNYGNVSEKSYSLAIGNKVRYEAVEHIKKHGALTVNQLSRYLRYSTSTVYYHLPALVSERILLFIRKNKREISFILNTEYFNYVNCTNENEMYENATDKSYSIAVGSDIRYSAVEYIRKYKVLTASQLSRLLHVSTSSMCENLAVLLQERIIKYVRKNRREIAYILNMEYYDHLYKKKIEHIKEHFPSNVFQDLVTKQSSFDVENIAE